MKRPFVVSVPVTKMPKNSQNRDAKNQNSILNYFLKSSQIDSVINSNSDLINEIRQNASANWLSVLNSQLNEPYMEQLNEFLNNERKAKTVYPPPDKIFTWLRACDFFEIKVVIIGQDPYHNPGQAHGLCFSVMPPCPPPPSLLNIYRELKTDLSIDSPNHGCLIGWARQGVLLLNSVLTVVKNQPNSHKGVGWEKFTDSIIVAIADKLKNVVFMLWGKDAQRKKDLISRKTDHLILCSTHPSPLSARRGFLGCKHFSKANEALRKAGINEINWAELPFE